MYVLLFHFFPCLLCGFGRSFARSFFFALSGYISRDRLNGILGVTRAFGDIGFKEYPAALGRSMWQGQQLTSQPETNSVSQPSSLPLALSLSFCDICRKCST